MNGSCARLGKFSRSHCSHPPWHSGTMGTLLIRHACLPTISSSGPIETGSSSRVRLSALARRRTMGSPSVSAKTLVYARARWRQMVWSVECICWFNRRVRSVLPTADDDAPPGAQFRWLELVVILVMFTPSLHSE